MILPSPPISLSQRVRCELLPYVEQPARYIGMEINSITKDHAACDLKVALAFPDAYNIGMSHLGMQILYTQCNQMDGIVAERVYTPWPDAEKLMRDRKIPLFTLESRTAVSAFDILGISLQYEMCFTNILTMMDLAGMPFRSSDRTRHHPLVICGGPQADAPEPIADFVDLIVMGDGEDAMAQLLPAIRQLRADGADRREQLLALARRFPWAYVPQFYRSRYHPDGRLASFEPSEPGVPQKLQRCQTVDFEAAPFPRAPIIPYIDVVHDRISIEIMRGCPQRCRFCHAGYTKRPLRLRSVQNILEIAEDAYRNTGIDEIGLLSLSTADYPHLAELTQAINHRFAHRHVNISMPSMRVDYQLRHIPKQVKSVRKSGLTIAVEAAREKMREAIRKKVTDGNLTEAVEAAYRNGWNSLKLYFMAGFPGECDDDIIGIGELAGQISELKRKVNGRPAAVKAAVSWLVPKPHTPFAWAAQQTGDYFSHARRLLIDYRQKHLKRLPVRITFHSIQRSLLEGVISRGDRRIGPVIERAWALGARMDGWDECFDSRIWHRAFKDCGVDPGFYAHRVRAGDELLPWDHLPGPRREYLLDQFEDAMQTLGMPVTV